MARALDVVGERWALLVVRELLLGPKRFSDLQAGLAGVSANVLSQRLRDLGRSGIVRRRRLGPPARTAAYELTEEGQPCEPVLIALSGWGRRRPLPDSGELSVDALVLALRTSVDPGRAGDLTVTVGPAGGFRRPRPGPTLLRRVPALSRRPTSDHRAFPARIGRGS